MAERIYNDKCICMEDVTERNRCVLSCGHVFCVNCTILTAMSISGQQFKCPMCREVIVTSNRQPNPNQNYLEERNNEIINRLNETRQRLVIIGERFERERIADLERLERERIAAAEREARRLEEEEREARRFEEERERIEEEFIREQGRFNREQERCNNERKRIDEEYQKEMEKNYTLIQFHVKKWRTEEEYNKLDHVNREFCSYIATKGMNKGKFCCSTNIKGYRNENPRCNECIKRKIKIPKI